MKLSTYFQITKPNYVYLKAIPVTSIRNYNSDKLAKTIALLYKTISQRIEIYNKKFYFELPVKTAYYIYISKKAVDFYFIIPEHYLTLIRDKITATWHGITLEQVKSVPTFSQKAVKYALNYKKEDALSLVADKRSNALLANILNVMEVIEEDDRVGIMYNFVPVNQYSWKAAHERTIKKVIEGKPVAKEKATLLYAFKLALNIAMEFAEIVFNVLDNIFGESTKTEEVKHNKLILSDDTKSKHNVCVVGVQGVICSQSNDRRRASNNAQSLCRSYDVLAANNEITNKRYRGNIDINQRLITDVDPMLMSPKECQQLLSLPGRELLESYTNIQRIETHESTVPSDLQNGWMNIGVNTCRGVKTQATLSTDPEYKNLTVCAVGPTRCGKSTLLQNLTRNAIDHGECVIVPDFISWGKLSYELRQVVPSEKQLIIDLEDVNNLPGMGYNELLINSNSDLECYESAKRQTAQLTALIDSISNKDLTGRMDRYTKSAALIVFANKGSIGDVFEVLRNHKKRSEYINGTRMSLLDEYVDNLRELDDVKKGEVVGTRMHLISGVLDRIEKLKDNTSVEIMLNTSCDKNVNLLDEIQKTQLIVIRMPDCKFSTRQEKDVICSYWFSKIWLTLQLRDNLIRDRSKRTQVNIIWDELYQIKYTQSLLASKLSQIAKFDCRNIVSCHYLEQIDVLKRELVGANTSYLLISGCDEKNYKEMANVLKPYTVEDLLKLKKYQSLNVIKCNKGYAKFITQLPTPIA